MKIKYLLIGINRAHDEIVKIFTHDISIDVINNHLKSYLSDMEYLQELTDKFDTFQKTLKEDGHDHETFDVIKWYMMEHKETYVTVEETKLIES